ncbi:MAG: hypothetical protein Q4A72_03790 [Bacillota bacterium]|nr:hypothetical protein [Bacillota bacterium]
MTPIVLILLGLALSFYSAIKLLQFSSQLSDKIEEMNALFSSDAFEVHRELRREMDELNYSYYEILERQDERISGLETKLDQLASFGLFDYKEKDGTVNKISISEAEDGLGTGEREAAEGLLQSASAEAAESAERTEPSQPPFEDGDLNSKVLALYQSGLCKEEIAGELNIGIGLVETICSIYCK